LESGWIGTTKKKLKLSWEEMKGGKELDSGISKPSEEVEEKSIRRLGGTDWVTGGGSSCVEKGEYIKRL